MNIGEANDVATLLHCLNGRQADAQVVIDAASRLEERVGKALQVRVPLAGPTMQRAVGRIYGDRTPLPKSEE